MTTTVMDAERERDIRAELLAAGWVQRGTRWVDCFTAFRRPTKQSRTHMRCSATDAASHP